ncbi:DUF397 domain-containing protein [Streptomyces sp. NPDC090442]|uniref:DUF397 domain-containing protein n=1 Tax=Streptomyces sp. NPDC090442 TaxID=3365962 RepID=UPI0037FC2FED
MIPDLDLAATTWVKSSYSDANGGQCLEFSRDFIWIKSSHSEGDGGACLEISPGHSTTHGVVPIRDSKVPDGDVVTVPAAGWSSFLRAVKNGELAAG